MLIHLTTEAVRTGSPVVDVEGSMTAFARSLGLATNGPHLRHLKDQLARLAAAQVRMGMVENGHAVQINTQIVGALDLWFPESPERRTLWPSTVRLSTDYFNSLKKHAVPLDRRAVGRWQVPRSPSTCTFGWPNGSTVSRPASRNSCRGQICKNNSAPAMPTSAISGGVSSTR